ncbi:iron-sulfur cluster assembly scaffold protein [Candidatus Parcubacteria bacterium]|nr:iron-sulfur cluster assembly scaffold protein [Candidatus Parcubacteria bacterium]
MYSKKIIDHFKKPRNVGKMKNPDGIGEAGNLLCGDLMKIYLKIGKNEKGEDFIEDIKFETLGCIVAIANTSLLTTLVKGKTIKEALKIKKEDLIKRLGHPLPPFKIHCSVLAVDALKEAIYDYYKKKGIKIPEELEKDHQRIVKVKTQIEEKYKEFRKLEKEVLE